MNFSLIKKKTRHVGGFAVGELKIQSTKHARHSREVVVVVVVVMFKLSMPQYSTGCCQFAANSVIIDKTGLKWYIKISFKSHENAMRTRLALLLPVACALGLSACSNAPDGFVAAPKVVTYFQGLVPSASKEPIEHIAICHMGGSYEERWATTVLFEDGNLYHYQLSPGLDAVELTDHSTQSQRNDKARNNEDSPRTCLGAWKPLSGYTGGSYRFKGTGSSMRGYVYERIVMNYPFDDEVRQRLKGAALAVQAAITANAKFTPIEASWGLEP